MPKDILACRLDQPWIKPPTSQLLGDLLCPLGHSHHPPPERERRERALRTLCPALVTVHVTEKTQHQSIFELEPFKCAISSFSHTQSSLSKHDRLSHSSCHSGWAEHTRARVLTLLLAPLKHSASPCSAAPSSWESPGRVGGRSRGESEVRRWSSQLKACPRVSRTAAPCSGWNSGPGGSGARPVSGHCPAGWREEKITR